MVIGRNVLLFVLFALTINVCHAEGSASPMQAIFDFHNGFWVNLHHFLFIAAQASSGIVTRPQGDSIDAKELESFLQIFVGT